MNKVAGAFFVIGFAIFIITAVVTFIAFHLGLWPHQLSCFAINSMTIAFAFFLLGLLCTAFWENEHS